jgi:transcriptional regulator with PAS, ATPase and Fis domain
VIFLDEVGELPLNLQVKLLKVLNDQKCRRLGGVKTIDLDVRVLAATNRDLKAMVKNGEFREDLFYRLYVVPVEIPPLRRRKEDILTLALYYLKIFNQKYNVTRSLGQDVLKVLENYNWPGNVRELQNIIERMVVTADSGVLEPRHLPTSLRHLQDQPDQPVICVPEGLSLQEAKAFLESEMISKAVTASKNMREAAKILGVAHSTVVRKAQKYRLRFNNGEESSQSDKLSRATPIEISERKGAPL